jgi:hypothetical protein
MLNGDYMVINEIIDLKWTMAQLNKSLTYMLKRKSNKKMIEIWSFESMIKFGH